MINGEFELVYSPKQVHEHLQVSDSSLRKYAMALEAKGHKFRKEESGNRVFTQNDIELFEFLRQRLDAGQSMKTAASLTMNDVRKNAPRTLPVPVPDPTLSERSPDAIRQQFEERFSVLIEERINIAIKPLSAGISDLTDLVLDLANQNKQLQIQNQELKTMLPDPRDKDEEERRQRLLVEEMKTLHEEQKKLELQHYDGLKRQNEELQKLIPLPPYYEEEQRRQNKVVEEMRILHEERFDEIKQQNKELQKLIPPTLGLEEERRERTNEYLTIRRINLALEKEAYDHWSRKPEAERIRKIGLFKKEEDVQKRNQFIKAYMDEYFEERLLKEFAL
jgi:DNA-binding transcriptional MerR regulator